jgi:hypothetical protein
MDIEQNIFFRYGYIKNNRVFGGIAKPVEQAQPV